MAVHKAGEPSSPFRDDILEGRVVLITGGATGIGFRCALPAPLPGLAPQPPPAAAARVGTCCLLRMPGAWAVWQLLADVRAARLQGRHRGAAEGGD